MKWLLTKLVLKNNRGRLKKEITSGRAINDRSRDLLRLPAVARVLLEIRLSVVAVNNR